MPGQFETTGDTSQVNAIRLEEDLAAITALRENPFWKNHLLPEIERIREEHRGGMRDQQKTAALRCEHVTTWETMQSLVEFLDKRERQIRGRLRDYAVQAPILEFGMNGSEP